MTAGFVSVNILRRTECDCGASIFRVRHEVTGRAVAIDVEPNENGDIQIIHNARGMFASSGKPTPGSRLYRRHAPACPLEPYRRS